MGYSPWGCRELDKKAGSILLTASAFNLMLYVVLAEVYKENSASHRL